MHYRRNSGLSVQTTREWAGHYISLGRRWGLFEIVGSQCKVYNFDARAPMELPARFSNREASSNYADEGCADGFSGKLNDTACFEVLSQIVEGFV